MREYFASSNEDHRLQNEWANLKQYGIVFEYVSVLTALTIRIPGLVQTQILDKFIRELKSKIRIEVELRDPKTPDEAYRLADRFDRIVYGARNNSFLTQNYNRYTPSSNANMNADYGEPMQIDTLRPRRPGPRNLQRPQSFQHSRNQELCFTCEKPGHIATNCSRQIRAIQEEISTGKKATSVEDGNSTDGKDKTGRTIAALSTKAPAKPNDSMKHGISDTDRRNSSAEDTNAGRKNDPAEDRKPARSKDTNHANGTGYKDKDPVRDTARGAIATLATTDGSTRRSKSSRIPTRSKDTKGVDGTGQGRKDSLEKRTLAASQTTETPESLRYPESRRSTSEDSMTQEEAELPEKRTESVISDNDEETSDMDMRLGYFGLGLHDQMEIPEADKLLEIVDQIEG